MEPDIIVNNSSSMAPLFAGGAIVISILLLYKDRLKGFIPAFFKQKQEIVKNNLNQLKDNQKNIVENIINTEKTLDEKQKDLENLINTSKEEIEKIISKKEALQAFKEW